MVIGCRGVTDYRDGVNGIEGCPAGVTGSYSLLGIDGFLHV